MLVIVIFSPKLPSLVSHLGLVDIRSCLQWAGLQPMTIKYPRWSTRLFMHVPSMDLLHFLSPGLRVRRWRESEWRATPFRAVRGDHVCSASGAGAASNLLWPAPLQGGRALELIAFDSIAVVIRDSQNIGRFEAFLHIYSSQRWCNYSFHGMTNSNRR